METQKILEKLHNQEAADMAFDKRENLKKKSSVKSIIDPDGEFSTNFFPIISKDEFLKFEEGLQKYLSWVVMFMKYIGDYHKRQADMTY